jgi:hypothetical protein
MREESDKWDLIKRVQLRVSFEDALSKLQKVKHQKFESALEASWKQGEDGNVTPQGKCWFFCWGWSGNTSDTTAELCKDLWNKIFQEDYNWFDLNVGIDFAREHRTGRGPISL